MPRQFGGKRIKSRSLNFDRPNLASALAAALAALLLAVAPSPARAASDDEPDTGIADDAGRERRRGPTKAGGQAGTGGLTVEGLVYWRSDMRNGSVHRLGEAAKL